jgi:phenol 2-monooxygenase
MFRIYIELDKLTENERAASLNITPERLVAAASRIFHPFSLEVKEIIWWSVYEIGQGLCEPPASTPASSSPVMPATPIAQKPARE